MGSNTYNLLCKPSELKTKARKLLNHKYGQSHAVTTKDLQIKLLKAEYLTQWPDNLIITEESMKKLKQYRVKTPGESLPSSLGNYLQKPNNEELYNTSTELYTDSEDTELYYVSNSTELYELDKLLVGIIQIHDTKMGATKTKTSLTSTVKPENNSVKLFTFKCPFIKCSLRSNTRKSLHQHYTTSHRQLNICKFCDKKYHTPHSLKQHLYGHLKIDMEHKCKICGQIFPFYSQLKIHRLSHTKIPKFTCDECYQPYKFRYDMLKHKKQHTVQCSTCEYEGTPLALKEHTRQHDPSKNITCKICFKTSFQMSHWRHRKLCKVRRSKSPAY